MVTPHQTPLSKSLTLELCMDTTPYNLEDLYPLFQISIVKNRYMCFMYLLFVIYKSIINLHAPFSPGPRNSVVYGLH